MVKNCPSGRLVAVDKATGEDIEPQLEQSISIITDAENADYGSVAAVFVKGGIEVEDENGEPYEVRNRVTLCRCGKSKNKPFCDSSHYDPE
jgi:hypothetical protein